MTLSFFKSNWQDLWIKGEKKILLWKILKRYQDEFKIDDRDAISFECADDPSERMIFSFIEVGGRSHCCIWDESKKIWIIAGTLYFRNEWGKYLFEDRWRSLRIRLPGTKRLVPLRYIFSECLGERFDGVAFRGKGKLDGLEPLLRLDQDQEIQHFYSDQRCEMFNEVTDEWEFWGTVVKKINKPPRLLEHKP